MTHVKSNAALSKPDHLYQALLRRGYFTEILPKFYTIFCCHDDNKQEETVALVLSGLEKENQFDGRIFVVLFTCTACAQKL